MKYRQQMSSSDEGVVLMNISYIDISLSKH